MGLFKIVNGAKSTVKENAKLRVVVNGTAYFLQRSVTPIEGGSEIVFTLNTTGVENGTNVDYTINNISPSDVISGDLNGSFTVNNNTASTTIEVSLEPESVGVNSATLTLNNGQASVSVFPPPTYTLTRSAELIDEGSSVTFTLTTTGVANGTNVPYSISGISAEDLSSGSLTGNFVINNGSASITLTAANDSLTEGSETITITAEGQSTTTTINDTSLTPVSPTYSLTRSAASVDEGSAITFTLTTTNVANGTNVAYTITGISIEDLSTGTLTGNFVVNNNTASITLIAYNDSLTEGTETMTITAGGQTTSATINDTSYGVQGPAETVLLLNGNGTAVYSDTFVDSSSNKFTITKGGSPLIRNFGPFSGGTGRSISFDGSSVLKIAHNSNLTFGSNDFTIEMWCYFNSPPTVCTLYSKRPNITINGGYCGVGIGAFSGNFSLAVSFDGSSWGILNQNIAPVDIGTWQHIAAVRNGNNFTFYKSGSAVYTTTNAGSVNDKGSSVTIGADSDATDFYTTGYISNFRIVNGTALYTTNFTPATAALTNVSGTSLLLNSGTINKADNDLFLDTSSNRFIINKSGSPTLATLSPFATSKRSIYFNGSSYLSTNRILDSNVDLTVEFWMYPTTSTVGKYIAAQYVLGGSDRTIFGANAMQIGSAATPSLNAPLNQWSHVAYVRSGNSTNNWTQYLNGVAVGNMTYTGTYENTPLTVGGSPNYGSESYFTGYVSNLRIVKGTAVYTTNFTPPTSPVTNITNTSLLLHAQPAVIDSSEKNPVIYTEGNSAMTTSVKKYGSGSLYFDGNGDYLTVPATSALAFGTGDFTIEAWVYRTNTYDTSFITNADGPINNNYYAVSIINDGSAQFQIRNSAGTQFFVTSLTNTVSSNVWTHVAAVRDSGTMKLFVNGTQVGTPLANSTDISQRNTIVGGFLFPGFNNFFNGYIDDLRITKNLARYTSNFTPPTQQLTINV